MTKTITCQLRFGVEGDGLTFKFKDEGPNHIRHCPQPSINTYLDLLEKYRDKTVKHILYFLDPKTHLGFTGGK